MDLNGFWTAEFGSSTGISGGGVALFDNGRILGGDGGYFYIGEYKETGNDFRATIRVSPFIKNHLSVFATVGRDITLDLTGSFVAEGQAIAQGQARELPGMRFGVKLTKRM